MLSDWPFYVFAVLAVGSASGVLFFKKLMNAAFSLMSCLVALAALYIYAGAEFLGVTQLLIYVGGIVVILIFGIMLSKVKTEEQQFSRKFIAALLSVGFSLLLIALIYEVSWPQQAIAERSEKHVQQLGISFFTDHLLSFELAGVLLLVALIGAIAVTASRR